MTKEEWTAELDFGGQHNPPFLTYEDIDHLWNISKKRNMEAVIWICQNIQWYADQESLWYEYRFNNFEIWSDDRMIIRVPNTKHLLINKNQ